MTFLPMKPSGDPPSQYNSQSGNVLFYILLAVALLAALSFAVTQSNRGPTDAAGSERAKLLASEIGEMANNIATAVGQVRLRGYTPEQISFENNLITGYVNNNCPDTGCEIYNLSGGGLTMQDVPDEAKETSISITFDGNMAIDGAGETCSSASCADLIVVFRGLKESVCEALNKQAGVPGSDIPTDGGFSFEQFTGSFGYSVTIGDQDEDLAFKRAACVKDSGNGSFNFYKVLIAR